jgi:VCBS repeat-containing protein
MRKAIALTTAVVLLTAAVVLGAPGATTPRSLKYACASAQYGVKGVLHYVPSRAQCAGRGKVLIEFAAGDWVRVCRKEPGGSAQRNRLTTQRRGPAGLVRTVDQPTLCGPRTQPNETYRVLPRSSHTYFCADRRSGVLRWVSKRKRCPSDEFFVALPPAGGLKRTGVARNDAAATSEDHRTVVEVLKNDSSGSRRRKMRVRSVETRGTTGKVSVTGSGRIEFDPAGRFEGLGPGRSTTDTFRYRAGDGVHAADAQVTVTISGVNDEPRAQGDAGSLSEDASVEVPVLANDTDPDGDALDLDSIDIGDTTGSVDAGSGGSTVFTAAGQFEELQVGESVHDTFRYRGIDASGAKSGLATVDLTVTGANDTPTLAGADSATLQYDTGDTALVFPALEAGDIDSPSLSKARVSIAAGYNGPSGTNGQDLLSVDVAGTGISADWDAATGVLTLDGPASPANFQQTLRTVRFSASSATSSGTRTVEVRLDDGAPLDHASNAVARAIDVTNHQPSVTADPSLIPAFSPDISDYAIRCSSAEPVEMQVSAPAGTEVAMDGDPPRGGSFGTSVDLASSQGFRFVVSRGARSATHAVRCLPPDFPGYSATVSAPPQTEWYFVSPSLLSGHGNYSAVFSRDGVPVWWMKGDSVPVDFKLLPKGNVGWFSFNAEFNEYNLDGALVRETNTVGTPTDHHEYLQLPNGNRFILSYRLRDHVDVSAHTGKMEDTDAAVYDAEIQELSPGGDLVWSWNSASRIDLSETGRWWTQDAPRKTPDNRNAYDITHINSIEIDGGGLVISLRHTDAVYRIVKSTGEVDWKLGGTTTPESLTILGDDTNAATDFGGQHDARILPDGTLTLHDNGTARGRAPRAMRFELDTDARTATLVEALSDPKAPSSTCCGGARKLPGGNWVMAWGASTLVTELTPDGSRPFELSFANGAFSYRAHPVLPGVLSAESLRSGMDAQHPRPG